MIFLLPIIVGVSIMIFYHLRSKNKQRELMIEKGINPDGLSIINYQKMVNLTNAILFISISTGILAGYILRRTLHLEDFLTLYIITVSFTCGLGFLINYFILNKKQKLKK